MLRVVSDTLTSIGVNEARVLGIYLLPQIVMFGEDSYKDNTEIDSTTFISKLKYSSTLPKTTAPNPTLYHPILKSLIDNGENVLIICPSSKVSGTFNHAVLAAKEFHEDKVRVIETPLVGAGFGTVVRLAVQWVKEGKKTDEIEKMVRELSARNRTYGLVRTLEYLHKGGRIGTAEKLIGNLLQVKPILGIIDGQVNAIDSQRTRKKAFEKFIEIVSQECPSDEKAYLNVQHGGVIDEAKNLAKILSERTGIKNIPISDLPSAILVHAGPGVLGASFFVLEP